MVFILQRRAIVKRFREAGAVSPSSARALSDVGVKPGLVFSRLAKAGVFVRGESDRYWLDAAAWKRLGDREGRYTLLFTVAILAVVVVALAMRT